MKISTFTIIKNEAQYVGYHIMSLLDAVDEMVFADGNSTDGTIEIIKYIQKKYDKDGKIKLFLNKDCKDLKESYVKLFNWTLKQCTGDYIWFVHPDMICRNPGAIRDSIDGNYIRYNVNMVSFAGDHKHIFTEGRGRKWATIYKNKFGLHYHGYYGEIDEDLYFRDITGDEHNLYAKYKYLPYKIKDTDIELYHYCDTKPYNRRLGRLIATLKNIWPGRHEIDYQELALNHPRVTITDGEFQGIKYRIEATKLKELGVFKKYGKELERLKRV